MFIWKVILIKIKCTFGRSNNNTIIEFIKNIERDILGVSPGEGNVPVYRIEEQLSQGFIKIFSDDEYKRTRVANIQILLKISGVWTDSTNYGITFRFIF